MDPKVSRPAWLRFMPPCPEGLHPIGRGGMAVAAMRTAFQGQMKHP